VEREASGTKRGRDPLRSRESNAVGSAGGGRLMEIKDIRKLIELMRENDLTEFEMEDQGFRISLKRRAAEEGGQSVPAVTMPVPSATPAITPPSPPQPAPAEKKDEEADLIPIKAPMVGTFYRAPSPEADPFVSVGQEVEEDTVVCIIEAMKVMNEIKAETKGVIRKILVENATPVEFGQVLFLVEPR